METISEEKNNKKISKLEENIINLSLTDEDYKIWIMNSL